MNISILDHDVEHCARRQQPDWIPTRLAEALAHSSSFFNALHLTRKKA